MIIWFNELFVYSTKWSFGSTNYLYIQLNDHLVQRIIYIFSEMIILIQRILYMFSEMIILIQRIIFISNERIAFLQRIIYIFNQFLWIQRWTNIFLHVQRFKIFFSGFQNTRITNFAPKFSNWFLGASRKIFHNNILSRRPKTYNTDL